MQFLLNDEIIEKVINSLNIKFKRIKDITLCGYNHCFDAYGRFYFEKCESNSIKYEICELDDANTYILDAFESALDFKKKVVYVESDGIEVYGYFAIVKNTKSDITSIDLIRQHFLENRQMNFCDLNLLIPAKTIKNVTLSSYKTYINEISNFRSECFNTILDEEYSGQFAKKINRACLGEVNLIVEEKGNTYIERGLVDFAYHSSTYFVVLEIYVPNVSIGANKILSHYTANKIKYKYNDKVFNTIEEFAVNLNLRLYGRRRSMVFCNNKISDEELINCLANEEHPMGKLGGLFKEKYAIENIASYNTAEVYVSSATMLEKWAEFDNNYLNRVEYEICETFFVELILMADAATEKIYEDIKAEQEKKLLYPNDFSTDIMNKISYQISEAIRFVDFEQFVFPTVRESAKKIAANFGIEYVHEKYKANKEILEQMINVNQEKVRKNENKVRNKALFILAALGVIDSICGVLSVFFDKVSEKNIYVVALVIALIAYFIYKKTIDKIKKGYDNGKN